MLKTEKLKMSCVVTTFMFLVVSAATPGPPYALSVVEVTKRHVELKWEAPTSDGGRPITK